MTSILPPGPDDHVTVRRIGVMAEIRTVRDCTIAGDLTPDVAAIVDRAERASIPHPLPSTIVHWDHGGRACPDGGTCHHECGAARCFRVDTCEPLSGVFPGERWPDVVHTLNAARPKRPAQIPHLHEVTGDDDAGRHLLRSAVLPRSWDPPSVIAAVFPPEAWEYR
jgi:hypothetical protein